MRKVKCPVCEKTKRPYGLPRTDEPRSLQPTQLEYAIGTYETKCTSCGTVLFIRMDYILELAPVDIKECWASDGTPGEVIDEKRGTKLKSTNTIKPVDPSNIPRPTRKRKLDD